MERSSNQSPDLKPDPDLTIKYDFTMNDIQGAKTMCEANAYIIENEEEPSLIMEAVDKVIPEEKGIRLLSIFGDQKFIKGYIHSLSLVDHKIFIKHSER